MSGFEVATTAGRVGGHEHAGIARFLGIPYAAPPVGAGRFRPPVPPHPWTGTFDAHDHGPLAPQAPSIMDDAMGTRGMPVAEDCLWLNVFTPATDAGARPVMVWIHGGGFTSGTAAAAWYDGTHLARTHDVVVVAVNYRLGLLGFTDVAAVAGEGFAGAANVGLLDQTLALGWVRDNIAGFGGDPGNVTVFGESAGGASVVALMAMPAAHGLFHRAIVQSASFTQLRSARRAADTARRTLDAAGVEAARAHDLLEAPLDRLKAAQDALLTDIADAFTTFSPSVDGVTITAPPDQPEGARWSTAVPLLIGTTRDERQLFALADPAFQNLSDDGLVEMCRPWFGDRAEHAVAAYRRYRPGFTTAQVGAAVGTDETFRIPAERYLRVRHSLGATSYAYWFTWASRAFGGMLGSCHGLELPFVFGTLDHPGAETFTGGGDDRAAVADAMQQAWVAFARTGDPGFPAWDPTHRRTMRFDTVSEVVTDPERELIDLWETR